MLCAGSPTRELNVVHRPYYLRLRVGNGYRCCRLPTDVRTSKVRERQWYATSFFSALFAPNGTWERHAANDGRHSVICCREKALKFVSRYILRVRRDGHSSRFSFLILIGFHFLVIFSSYDAIQTPEKCFNDIGKPIAIM